MLGVKAKCFKRRPGLSLEDLVPADNFYRQLDASLDLTLVRFLACRPPLLSGIFRQAV